MPFESLSAVIILSILVEFVTNVIKAIIPQIKHHNFSQGAAAITGIVLCMGTRVGILQSLNIHVVLPVLDYVVTGLLVSRGSNVIHDMSQVFQKNVSR